MQEKKISIVDLLLLLLEYKKFLIGGMAFISVAAVVTVLLLPEYFTAQAVLLPSSGMSMNNPMSSVLGDLPLNMMKSFDFLDGGSDNDQLLSILESRRLAEKAIDKYDLITRYKFHKKKKYYIEDVIRRFNKDFSVTETDLKNLSLSFTDKNPGFSAELLNYLIGELDSINSEISRNNARNTRQFFERRVAIVKAAMDSAHQRFADFQQEHNYIDLEKQVGASIDALSKVEAQILSSDINLEFLKNRYGAGSYEVRELRRERGVLQQRMSHYLDSGSGELIISLKDAPRLGIEYTYLLRAVKVQEMLHAFLLQNYEQARLSEANNTPTVNVLEYAKPPQKRSRPKRMIFCMLSFFGGFVLLSLLSLIHKWYVIQVAEKSESYAKVSAVLSQLKKW